MTGQQATSATIRLVITPTDSLSPAPDGQARRSFSASGLQGLAASLRRSGLRSPILVAPDPSLPGRFRIVAGERRWRAAQLAGLAEVPCIVDENLANVNRRLLAQAEENLLREDLNAVEEAEVLVQLIKAFGVDAREAGALIGRSYQQARRLIQLHEAPEPIRDAIVQGHLDARAALELVRIHNRLAQRRGPDEARRATTELDELIDRVVNEHWSIRRLEQYARELEAGRRPRKRERRLVTDQASPDGEYVDAGAPTPKALPSDGPPYRRDGAGLLLDVDRIARGEVSPEEREQLIGILEQLLMQVRRVGALQRRPVLHVENARKNAKP